jgi:hypothetical protein
MVNSDSSTAGVALAERVRAIAHEFPSGEFEHWTAFAVLRWPIPDDQPGLLSLADALVAELHGLVHPAPRAARACLEKLRTCVQRAEQMLPPGHPDLAALRRDVVAAELRLGVRRTADRPEVATPLVPVMALVTVLAMVVASAWVVRG